MRKHNYPALIVFVVGLFALSYVQSNIYLLINGVIENTAAYKANIEIPAFLYQLSYANLMIIKYTIGILYIALSYYLLFRTSLSHELNRTYRIFIRFIYILLIVVILFFQVLSFQWHSTFYGISLYLFKILISPIFPFVLFIIGYMPLFNETLPHNKRK